MTDRVAEIAIELARETRILQAHLALHETFALTRGLFVSSELVAWAQTPQHSRLQKALLAALGCDLTAHAVTSFLARWEGRELGGFIVRKHGRDRDGMRWEVCLADDRRHAGPHECAKSPKV